MINALWRFILTLIFLASLLLVLAIIWDVPTYLGYALPGDFSKLPSTLLIILAMLTWVWGTWSRKSRPEIQRTMPAYPPSKGNAFSVLPPTSGPLSPVEQANTVPPSPHA